MRWSQIVLRFCTCITVNIMCDNFFFQLLVQPVTLSGMCCLLLLIICISASLSALQTFCLRHCACARVAFIWLSSSVELLFLTKSPSVLSASAIKICILNRNLGTTFQLKASLPSTFKISQRKISFYATIRPWKLLKVQANYYDECESLLNIIL